MSIPAHLGHGSIAVTLDLYSHVVSGLQEVAAQRFEGTLDREALKLLTDTDLADKDVGKMSARSWILSVSRRGLEPLTC